MKDALDLLNMLDIYDHSIIWVHPNGSKGFSYECMEDLYEHQSMGEAGRTDAPPGSQPWELEFPKTINTYELLQAGVQIQWG